MKTFLITGGSGYVGSHLVVDLLLAGNNVIVVDSYINSKPEIEKKIYEIGKIENYSFQNKLLFFKGDIRDEAFLKRVIIAMKNCGLTTYIFGNRWDTSTIPVL